MLQNFAYGGFWLAEVQDNELEEKTNQVVYSSLAFMLPKENMSETCKTSQEPPGSLQMALYLAQVLFCKSSVVYYLIISSQACIIHAIEDSF